MKPLARSSGRWCTRTARGGSPSMWISTRWPCSYTLTAGRHAVLRCTNTSARSITSYAPRTPTNSAISNRHPCKADGKRGDAERARARRASGRVCGTSCSTQGRGVGGDSSADTPSGTQARTCPRGDACRNGGSKRKRERAILMLEDGSPSHLGNAPGSSGAAAGQTGSLYGSGGAVYVIDRAARSRVHRTV